MPENGKLLFEINQQIRSKPEFESAGEMERLADSLAGILDQRFTAVSGGLNDSEAGAWSEILQWMSTEHLLARFASRLNEDTFFVFGETLAGMESENKVAASILNQYLNIFRRPEFLDKIYGQERWERLVLELISKAGYSVSQLFMHRAEEYPAKTLFRVFRGKESYSYNWSQIKLLVEEHARAILSLDRAGDFSGRKVGFLMENSLDMAVLDLACLTTGIVNIMIPANSVAQHLEFILNQTAAEFLIVSNERQLNKVKQVKNKLRHLKKVVTLDGAYSEDWIMSLEDLLRQGESVPHNHLLRMRESIGIDDLATIMYTSGTTGEPKGIMFSQMNLIYKRFCRAMALPEIGESDRFVSYLPLFHTFGRYLEMLGCVFWGAEYIFLENPALATLLDTMQRVRPTVFISIPKKWNELYTHITEQVNVMVDDERLIRQAVDKATGGKLRWGLSAAGYLEPDIFTFFQKYGIELMSGFGMTEATGGITMTPPGRYVPNSLGKPLPGVEVKLSEDGEMLIRGSYVMTGYYKIDDKETFEDGWLPTGDIMKTDSNGFYEIVDRKKEIYKNLRGETIAPQRIENLFRDFEFVKQVFLVGDQKLFNTVLIYPDEERFRSMNPGEQEAYVSSIIVTVNKFLAPYERIVDFRIIDRPFSAEEGELTPKGTFKRKVIERHFSETISAMYTMNYTSLNWDETEIRVPNWFLREMGCLKQDIRVTGEAISIPKIDTRLPIAGVDKKQHLYQVGDYIYHIPSSVIDLQMLLSNPHYWLGNQGLAEFSANNMLSWYRLEEPSAQIGFHSATPAEGGEKYMERFKRISEAGERSLEGLHLALYFLRTCDPSMANNGFSYLSELIEQEHHPLHDITLAVIARPRMACTLDIRRQVFAYGLKRFNDFRVKDYLSDFIRINPDFIDDSVARTIVTMLKGAEPVHYIREIIDELIGVPETDRLSESAVPSLLNLLSLFGIRHPTLYKRVRQILVEYQLSDGLKELAALAGEARTGMLKGFREWLGDNQQVAVDVETGGEYEWPDVMTFELDIDEEHRRRMVDLITGTSILREAIFLFSGGAIIRLYDIPQGGIWISRVGALEDKSLYRVSVQTRYQGAYELVIVLDHARDVPAAKSEVNWIIHSSALRNGVRLVDEFGGYWPEHHAWSEAFVPGEPVARILQRSARQLDEEKKNRLYHLWRYIIWTACCAHVQFWQRSRYTLELEDKTIHNIIVPEHDYQTGERFVSIARRMASTGLYELICDLYEKLVTGGESEYPFLKDGASWSYVFSGLFEALGDEKGIATLEELLGEAHEKNREMEAELRRFLQNIRERGFLPRPLFFAIKRFHRWLHLNRHASMTAQALTLNEFYDTYQLNALEKRFPEVRTRFFLETVFRHSSQELQGALQDIVNKQRSGEYSGKETLAVLARIQKEYPLSEGEVYFLTRLSYPHLKPTDTAFFVQESEETAVSPDVVIRLEDYDGHVFWIRQPMSPKEISRLHQLFLENNLPVNFRSDDHFLVAVSERGYIIGGLFYNYSGSSTVHMDKIVVADRFRRKGVSEGLMNEFFNRMRDEHLDFVTTGFLRPEYFYRFGFKIERKYAGLVKDLRVRSPQD